MLLSCSDLVKYLGSMTMLLKNGYVPLAATQQPLPSYLACSSSTAGLDKLEAWCDVSHFFFPYNFFSPYYYKVRIWIAKEVPV